MQKVQPCEGQHSNKVPNVLYHELGNEVEAIPKTLRTLGRLQFTQQPG